MSQAATRMMLHSMPEMLHSAAMPEVNRVENKDILRSAMVTPEIRQQTHENNILQTGLPPHARKHMPELIPESSRANMKANGKPAKTPNHPGTVRFPGSKH